MGPFVGVFCSVGSLENQLGNSLRLMRDSSEEHSPEPLSSRVGRLELIVADGFSPLIGGFGNRNDVCFEALFVETSVFGGFAIGLWLFVIQENYILMNGEVFHMGYLKYGDRKSTL